MAKTKKLSDAEVQAGLKELPGWSIQNAKLHREFQFADFIHAFGFMAACATLAEQMNHHPEWFNVYRTVRVDLTTHDCGGISENDLKMAAKMNSLAAALGA